MPTKPEDYSKIKSYQDEAAAKTAQSAQYVSGSNVLGDKVMEAVRADRVQRGVSKLATDVGNVSGQMVTDPNAIREGPQSLSGQGLVDPFSVNALTSNARAQNLRTLGTIATQTAANQGSIDEVIQAGANQLKARAQTLLAEAEKATAAANSLQQEWDRQMQAQQFAADQAYKQQQLEIDWYNATNKGSGGSTGEMTLEDLFRISELSQGEQSMLTNWTTAKNSIATLQNLEEKDFKAAMQSGTLGSVLRLTNAKARTANTNAINLKDLLARSRTGAAINTEEEKLYTDFVQGDPIQTLMGYKEGPREALRILSEIADRNTQYYMKKENVANSIYDTWTSGFGGQVGTSSDPLGLFGGK